jgi:hypothetical protein
VVVLIFEEKRFTSVVVFAFIVVGFDLVVTLRVGIG